MEPTDKSNSGITIPGEQVTGTQNPGEQVTGTQNPGDQAKSSIPEYEVTAREKGWRPQEEFEGDKDSWVGAEEFIKRQPLFDKIKTQSKRLKELEKTVEALGKHYNENIETAKKRAIADLKAERKEAIELGEADKVEQIDQRITEVQKIAAPAPVHLLPTEIEQFIEDHKDWWEKDEELTTFAISWNESYLKKHPGDLGKSLEETTKMIKKVFPEKFANQRRQALPYVEGAGAVQKGSEKYSYTKLNKEQKLVYDQLVKTHKQMSHDEYFKSLEEAGYLDN